MVNKTYCLTIPVYWRVKNVKAIENKLLQECLRKKL